MSGFDHLDLIWLSERNMAVIYVSGDAPGDFVTAAIILKGADGTDQFIPYEGYLEGAPIGFSIGRDETYSVSVIGFGPSTEPIELAMWTLDKDFLGDSFLSSGAQFPKSQSPKSQSSKSLPSNSLALIETSDAVDMSLLGFGERTRDWQEETLSEIGFNTIDYSLQGGVEYSDLLSNFLQDMRGLDDETFTSFFVTATPSKTLDDEVIVGPSLHLRPMHHFHFGLSVQCHSLVIEEEALRVDAGTIYGEVEELSNPMEGAAILNRHGGLETRDVPELILNAGPTRDQVDFLLGHGYQIHWRRQFENWSSDDGVTGHAPETEFLDVSSLGISSLQAGRSDGRPFIMQPFLERSHLLQHEGQHFFRFEVEDAIIGDVVGVVFSSEEASLDIDLHIEGELKYQLQSEKALLFIFMGADGFVPLTDDILMMPDNLGVSARLEGHIDQALKSVQSSRSLKKERYRSAKGLLERDSSLQEIFETDALQDLASDGPFGPELMVYRDHILRVAHSADMAHWMVDLSAAPKGMRRGKLIDMLRFEMFNKAPQLAHALVFNQSFRQKFQSKPIDPHSFQMPVLEYLMSKLYSDPVIDWAMRLKGESQAILWHLVLKRPDMVEQLYDLKLEPDIALNPFDDQVLSHVETALQDSHQINVDLIEKKVIPIFRAMGDDAKAKDLTDFAHALQFGADGKALSLGELSVCLAAVERASDQWSLWCEQASSIFQPLVDPLGLDLPLFDKSAGGDTEPGADEDITFEAAKNADELRRSIGHLIERLIKEQELPSELLDQGLEFIDGLETNVLLEEIAKKLDLALKYQRDLAVGVQVVFDEFDVTLNDLEIIQSLSPEIWPKLADFPPSFADPLKKQQRSSKSVFDKLIKNFAQKAHPNDELFHTTLKNALSDLETSLPLLHWLEVGEDMEKRVKTLQKKLNTALLKVNPASVKLRRSKVLSQAVKDIVEAERQGPFGWPLLVQSLDIIEQDLPKELM